MWWSFWHVSLRLALQEPRQERSPCVKRGFGNLVGVFKRHLRGAGWKYYQIGLRKRNKSLRFIGSPLGTACGDRDGEYFEENELEADDLCSDSENLLEHKVNYGSRAYCYEQYSLLLAKAKFFFIFHLKIFGKFFKAFKKDFKLKKLTASKRLHF